MKKFVVLILILTVSNAYSQSPWVQKKGKAYTQLSFTSISGYTGLYGDPDYPTERKISDNTLQFFAEYGLTDKTSILLNIPFKMVKAGDLTNAANLTPITQSGSESSLGNIEVGIKHVFSQKKWIFSGQFNIEANSGNSYANSGLRTGYDAWSFTPMFLAGRSFGNTYVQGFLGTNIRTNNYSSNFKIGGEVGTKAFKNIWLIGFVDISSSFKNGDVLIPATNQQTGLYVNDQEYGAMGIKAIAELNKNFGVNVGFGGAFSGNNVPKRAAISFGLYHKF
ncbi:hypothetical protein RQM59_03235 [Flavobacteriaceae bacterium S356]|uniref:Transporter n=1 Tax=Asprobacillus argus TaxID=3076534 RepID=A0ABU3LDJ9_9FLAO|nr:hypothetical protein [Flavobacteriaceae bacterium S356]